VIRVESVPKPARFCICDDAGLISLPRRTVNTPNPALKAVGFLSHLREGYCWPTSFKVLGVLFLEEVSSAFLPSKKVCWTHKFRYMGVGQQYWEGYCWPTYFNVLGVLVLGDVSSAFLPLKKASWTLKFRSLGVGQQYPGVNLTHKRNMK
jgi:hypothetical protein